MSTTARISPLEPPYEPEVAKALAKMMPPGAGMDPLRIFRTLARNIGVGRRMASLGGSLLAGGRLDIGTRELAILRTTARCGAEYEWGVHVTWLASAAGLTEQQVSATVAADADDPVWSDEQALVIRLVDELHDSSTISDPLWTTLSERWDEASLVELIVVVGFYHAISFVVNGARVAHEDWAARFPLE
jgi:alkylhydroperoxidase family enzyme